MTGNPKKSTKPSHGGARRNAGRPKGVGPHGETTKPVRIPISLLDAIGPLIATKGKIPFYGSRVAAGKPGSGDDHVQEYVNLYKKLVPDPENIFCVVAHGDSMIDAGIHDGDLLIVNAREEGAHKKIVIASVNGEQTVKTLHRDKTQTLLLPENKNYQPIPITADMDFMIQGVVKHCIRSFG